MLQTAYDESNTGSYFVKYYPNLKKVYGSHKAAFIAGRLEYWFERKKNGFYKFIEPCNHPCYRIGDSWSEELGLSWKEFTHAFDTIGIRYKSKSAYLKEENPFKDKLYLCYYNRKTNQMFFLNKTSQLKSLTKVRNNCTNETVLFDQESSV